MNIIKKLNVILFAFAIVSISAIAADDSKGSKDKKETCCQKAKADGKECVHKCCVDAHKAGKSCEKCNKNKEDVKNDPKKS